MKTLAEQLSQYATCHRDRRNIATHFVGIPLIVFSIGVLLSRPELFSVGGFPVTPAWLLWVASTVWYLTRGNLALGAGVSLTNGVLILLAHSLALDSTAAWLGWGIGSFAAGWVIQFIGHYYEGRKPAFVDDVIGLLVGPMFVTGEGMFALGWGKPLLDEIERRTGPTVLRDLSATAHR